MIKSAKSANKAKLFTAEALRVFNNTQECPSVWLSPGFSRESIFAGKAYTNIHFLCVSAPLRLKNIADLC